VAHFLVPPGQSSAGYDVLVRIVNQGHYTSVQITNAFCQWIHANGHVVQGLLNRRVDEANLFNNGQY
jgi:GH24 family phage-related lysozyme (muramidase)